MTPYQKGCGTITVELESGGQFAIEFECNMAHYSTSGNGWNEPCEPAHWECEDFEPTALIIVHPDGDETYLDTPVGSLLYTFVQNILEHQNIEDLTEAVKEYEE